ncbi:sulfotransferase family 2 domain-containing protein [Actibacterium lipolyticum]|uniref:Nodulation protein NodH n=1 Tax=Actibacterium lipolyticum TaxID=1524263 RepID=A0A238KW73_9RHOB|nr:sulfotransferase family 2 domain-containing protein [Actibacterium lipolyticum]SMX46831.1 hypothetical protein COL8621_03262 [Actibacterium lipolyticum]
MSGKFDYFVVLAEMRTGSNFLESNINAFEGLRCYGEVFNPHFIGQKSRRELFGVDMALREADPLKLITAIKAETHALPGFRFFHDHDPRIMDHVLNDPRCAKIILTRNPVDSYVSLMIARETGQWKLGDMKHQRSATVTFDADDFERYLAGIQGAQLRLQRSLQTSGQTAFYIAYDDLRDVDVLNGLARFLGVTETVKALAGGVKKQNPAPLSEKVSNYADMQAALAGLDRFDLSRTPSFEPRRGPLVPGYVAAANAPLIYLPLHGGPVTQVEGWLSAIDGGTPNDLRRKFTQKTLRQWKRRNPGHRSFTVVTHPVQRAHTAFCERILSTGEGSNPELRAVLVDNYKLPVPKNGPDENYGAVQHRTAFLAFLNFLKGNLGGQTSVRVDPSWASQSNLLQGMGEFALPDMVMREERLAEDLALIAGMVGCNVPDVDAPPQLPVALSEIYDEEVEAAARDVYQRDYMTFGYRAWRA